MDRKKTILIAVMINAGLLAILFIASLATQEEAAPEIAASPLSSLERPLFPDSADLALQQQTAAVNSIAAPPPIQLPIPEMKSPEPAPPLAQTPATPEPLVHKLPPLVPEALPAAPAPTPAPPVAAVKAEPALLEVVVKKGDSLDKIAKAHHTTVDEIIKINQLPSSFLRVGQKLKLPADKGAVAAKPKPLAEKPIAAASSEYYTVKVGDNPWTIAMKHHIKVEELLKLNHLNEEKARKLKPGDRLRIR